MTGKPRTLLLLSVLMVGCSLGIRADDSTVMPHEFGSAASTLAESAASPPPSVRPNLTCPVPLGAPPLPDVAPSSDWATSILTYLNQGGSITAFIEALPSLGQTDPQSPAAVLTDLTGDRLEDLVITVTIQEQEQTPGESMLLIYLCDQDLYRLAYAASALPDADRFHLDQVIDLSGDGLSEILVMQEFCGAHTCFRAWEVLQWQTNRFVNILEGRTDDLPSPTIEISSPNQDGSLILEITGQGVQSAGAGPGRPLTRIWNWSQTTSRFIVHAERLSAPSFRIHALHDADQAALEGNTREALSGYTRVIEDPDLDDYSFGEQGRTQLSAYALYRSMLVWLQIGDLPQAEATLIFLREAFPQDGTGAAYSQLAAMVWQAYQIQADLGHACQIAQAYALENPGTILEPLNYGYANKYYLAIDICPFTS